MFASLLLSSASALVPPAPIRTASPTTQLNVVNSIKRLLGNGPQNFLEAKPYYDMKNIPVNTYKNKAPFTGKIASVKRIVGPKATGETCDIIIKHGGKMPYWEGQSYGVIPPGKNPAVWVSLEIISMRT